MPIQKLKKNSKKTPEIIAEITKKNPGKVVEIWFEDEARLGQKGTMTRVWAEKGSRPRAPLQGGFKSLQIFGAVCPKTGQSEALILESLNCQTTQMFLEQLSKSVSQDKHIALFWDNAGFHSLKQIKLPENITVVSLPPRSPELNPVENLWNYLRNHEWANRTFKDLDAIEEAVVVAWRRHCSAPEKIKTICACHYTD